MICPSCNKDKMSQYKTYLDYLNGRLVGNKWRVRCRCHSCKYTYTYFGVRLDGDPTKP